MDPVREQPATAGRLWQWIARRPRRAFWATLATGLLVGITVGAAAGSSTEERDAARAAANAAKGRSVLLEKERNGLRTELADAEARADDAERHAKSVDARIKKLTAKAEVPTFKGDTAADVRANDIVRELDWKIETSEQVTSDAAPGTVIAQAPRAGTTLKTGKQVTLVIAKQPPKQWVTIASFQGADATKTSEFRIPPNSKARLIYSMPGDTNNAITLMRPPDEYVDLMLNEIGPQQGTTRLYQSGVMYLDVMGSYSVQVQVFKRPE